ncbi:MAG: RAMP superfamily CRISPR-associated protein [Chloroflexota bacterium]
MKRYVVQVSLTILGPFLTAATGPDTYGLQKSFFRDHQDRLTIPASHIKGKLRMALEELDAFSDDSLVIDVARWFGERSDAQDPGSYEPSPGLLEFSDFTCVATPRATKRTRVAINHISFTAAENQLRDVEEVFGSGTGVVSQGTITFFSASDQEARQITRALQIGFQWLTNLGAEKGVGFGRLLRVWVSNPEDQGVPKLDTTTLSVGDTLHLRVQPLEPILVGGVKKPRTNYVPSNKILSGGLIKGALTAGLNRAHGIFPLHRKLSVETAHTFSGFETLVENFALIRVSHAFPAHATKPRPVKFPISAVQGGNHYADTALSAEPYAMIGDQAPAYFIDWKESKEYFGDATPKEIFVTRTEIDDLSRRSLERQLFTYAFICPEDEKGRAIEWVCNVDFSGIGDPGMRQQVKQEFAQAVYGYLDRLGKLGRRVRIEVRDGEAQAAQESDDLIKDGWIVITLQTDALMLNPQDVRQLPPEGDLHHLYDAFWQEISGGGCMELVDFFAHQTFKGGYLYHRYLGAAERTTRPNNYRPYYLTGAGSVFKLRPLDEQKAHACLAKWRQSGLDLPAWAKVEYSHPGMALWQTCPFVPENGYGEIVVNLKWHWENKL